MVDIDVVKKGSNLWLWIVLAVVIGLALWFMLAGSGTGVNGSGTRLNDGARPALIAAPAAPADTYA